MTLAKEVRALVEQLSIGIILGILRRQVSAVERRDQREPEFFPSWKAVTRRPAEVGV
jgi:hypothetical protein